MTFTAKALADGQVPNTKSALYTSPSNTTTLIKGMTFVNTSSTPQTLTLFSNRSGSSRQYISVTLEENETLVADGALTLETGDVLEAETTTATVVDYTISGVQIS
jgi:hypothetical protein